MHENPHALPADDPDADRDRRVWIRHACDLESSCEPVLAQDVHQWQATVRDVSQGGIRLEVSRRFERHTVLQIELPLSGEQEPLRVLARVIKITTQSKGMWCLGCVLARPLTADQLQSALNLHDGVGQKPPV
jgi:hypothetical protein